MLQRRTMYLRKIFAICALAVMASTGALAQPAAGFSNAASQIPWNQYVPSRIPDGYSTIIGLSGTTGPITATSTNVAMPFPFYFMGQLLPTGFNLSIALPGYMSLNGGTTITYTYPAIVYNIGSGTYNYYDKVISPYWSDLVAASGGGYYYRSDGTTPNRVLTVEWRMIGQSYGTQGPGNFQAKLYEGTGNIEFHYGATSIDRNLCSTNPQQLSYGAWVGLKNLGQAQTGNPTGNDAEKFLIFCHPDQNINGNYVTGGEHPGSDTVAITRLRTGLYGGSNQYYCEVYAYYPSYMWIYAAAYTYYIGSPYWHYSFPTLNGTRCAYRMSPVINDVGADSAWFTPTRAANAFAIGDQVTVNARFKNYGANSRLNVPVKYDVYRNGTGSALVSGSGTAFFTATPQFQTSSMTFTTTIGQPYTNVTGLYQVRIYPQLTSPIDQDFKNDTLYANFYISRTNDLMTYALLQPISNEAPLFNKYPVGVGVPLETRFLNIGTNPQTNARVGYVIYNDQGGVVTSNTITVNGVWGPISFRDINFPSWTPTQPGRYYYKAFTLLDGDEDVTNDTIPRWPALGKPFDVLYEIEVSAANPQLQPHSPFMNQFYPDGRPLPVSLRFLNAGVSDATNVPATVIITYNGNVVYNRTVSVLNIPSGGLAPAEQRFPDFTPNGPGQYCVTAYSNYSQEPLRGNDTARWCFNVKARLAGTIRVGFGERYRTISEARDSLFTYGVGGPLTFELVDDSYLVQKTEPTIPALDFRGGVVGLGPNNPVVWRPIAGKTDVRVDLRSGSGIGVWYGQLDTSNPNGYITWDGGANRVLHFTFQNTGTVNRALPFFFGQGASNYTIKNVRIDPVTGGGKLTATLIPMPGYTQAFNQFTFTQDLNLTASAGIMLRNSVVDLTGRTTRPDTLRNQNNTFDNNQIGGFAYGILSVGAGPLFYLQTGGYQEFLNQTNHYTNNLIQDVSRGGIVVAYEKGSEISGNTIRRVLNTSTTVANAAGIAATAGGNPNNNRAYSTDLIIENNRIATINAAVGSGGAIGVETAEDVFISPTNTTWRFPGNSGATNMRVRNNMAWDYNGQVTTAGIALYPEASARIDFTTSGNRIENNTIYNQIAGTSSESGLYVVRAGTTIKNNIIALVSPTTNPLAIYLNVPNYKQTIQSDYNLFWVPFGAVGYVNNLSSNGYQIPSAPAGLTLNQWRALTGLDQNSVQGNVTTEFTSTAPGAVDLHINANTVGSYANNRGTAIGDLARDIDGDPRGTSPTGRYDIGADEFNGLVRNFDLAAEDIIAPAGYRAPFGQYSDGEYVMVGRGAVPVKGIVRNVGGSPMASNTSTLQIERYTGSSWVSVNGAGVQAASSVDVNATRQLDFGSFTPQTLRQVGQNDAFYGVNPNVTPLYRFRLSTGTDQFSGNDTLVKTVRFYVQQSDRKTLVAVKGFQAAMPVDAIGKSNKLNSDTLIAALNQINWGRADGVGVEDYDLFERDRWPSTGLNFVPWQTVIWAQGEDANGLVPEERVAIKAMLSSGDLYNRKNLVIAGQEVARIHDVALNATNGQVADQDFVLNYLRADYTMNTTPADYSNRRIRGVAITPGKYELIAPTGVAGDQAPTPSALRTTTGAGIARATHAYVDQTGGGLDTMAGVAATATVYNSVYYAFDWRHAGRFQFEPTKSGAQRLLLGALDYIDQFRGILPVELTSFNAYQSARAAVTVEWATASETKIGGLEIERADVVRNETGVVEGVYSVIDRKTPQGTATSGANYTSIDQNVRVGSEYSYRLVSVGLDGSRSVEETRMVKISADGASSMSLTVLPNPVRSSGTIEYRLAAGTTARVVLFDATGRQVSVLTESANGSGSISLPVAELASGVYTVRLETATGALLTEKVTVQK